MAFKWVRGFMLWLAALMLSLVPLCPSSSAETSEGSAAPYERVIIIGLDGAGAFFRGADTPNFDRIFAEGNVTWDGYAPYPTLSANGWGSILYGVSSDVHGLSNALINSTPFHNPRLTSIFGAVKKRWPDADVASIATAKAFDTGIIDTADDIYRFPSGKSVGRGAMMRKTWEYLDSHDPKLLFCYFGDTDAAGHAYGYGSEKYLQVVRDIDACIGELYDGFEERGLLENALFMIVTDHGGTPEGTHGETSQAETQVFFAVRGKHVPQGTEIRDLELRDIAAITLYALGIDIPETYSGRVPVGVFEGVGGGARGNDYRETDLKQYRGHKTVKETPALDLSDSLISMIRYRQTFDGESIEGLGGKKMLVSGWFGKALNTSASWIDTGVALDPSWPGVTFSMWIKAGSLKGDPLFITNKNWSTGDNAGIAVAWLKKYYKVNFGTGNKGSAEAYFTYMPDKFTRGWSHLLVSIDLINKTFTLYEDFRPAFTSTFGEGIDDILSLCTENSFTVGQDVTGKYSSKLNAALDEVMIFNAALTIDDVEELRLFYTR